MSERFKPTREDGRSYRDVTVDLFKNLVPNTIVNYEQLGKELELNPESDRNRIQMAVRSANKVLLKMHNRGVTNVPTVGYRVLEAREHMIVANGHQNKADRALIRAQNFYEGTNLSEMTQHER